VGPQSALLVLAVAALAAAALRMSAAIGAAGRLERVLAAAPAATAIAVGEATLLGLVGLGSSPPPPPS